MSAAGEVFQVVRGSGAAFTALRSGSMILAGKLCGCIATALRWAWDQASVDPEATAAAQAAADKKAKAKAAKTKKAKPDDDQDDEAEDEPEVKAARVAPVRRPVPETLGMLTIAGTLAAGALGTAGTLGWPHVLPYVQMLAPWRGLIAGAGGLAWMTAAWMVAPPAPAKTQVEEVDDQEVAEPGDFAGEDLEEGEGSADEPEETVPDRLARHVLSVLAALEKTGRPAVHVKTLLASAEEAKLLVSGAMNKLAFRDWLEASGIPVTKTVNIKGDRDFGVRVERVRETLGMGPGEALARLVGGGTRTAPPAPASTPAEPPVRTPAEAPRPAAAAPAQAPRLTLVKPLPEDGFQEAAQGVG